MSKISWRVHSTWFLTVCLMALFPLLQGSSMAQTPQSGVRPKRSILKIFRIGLVSLRRLKERPLNF